MTNEALAHELLWDPLFQLDESGGCSIENPVFHRIRESFHQVNHIIIIIIILNSSFFFFILLMIFFIVCMILLLSGFLEQLG